jgi:hypothetical protein
MADIPRAFGTILRKRNQRLEALKTLLCPSPEGV